MKKIIIDARSTVVIDQAGLGTLLSLARQAKQYGDTRLVIVPSGQLRTVVSAKGLEGQLELVPTIEAARNG